MRFLSACEKTPRKQDKNLVTSVSSKHKMFLECVFALFPGVVDRSGFTSAFVIHVFVEKHLLRYAACHYDYILLELMRPLLR